MRIFNLFRTKPDHTHTLLTQMIQEQRELINRVDVLTQQVDALRVASTRTSISTPIKTIAVTTQMPDTPRILAFLQHAGISIKTVPIAQEHDDVFNEIALLMGNKYYTITPLLDQIKRTMQHGNSFQLHVGHEQQQAIADMTLVGYKLHELALLCEYLYKKSPQCTIIARPSNEPRAQNFFSGQWLERYIAGMVSTYASEACVNDFEILMNPQVILPNGNNFELDVLIHANQRIYWIETKTGQYQDHIGKYSRLTSELQLPANQMLMILPDIKDSASVNLSMMFRMKVMNITHAHDYLAYELKRR